MTTVNENRPDVKWTGNDMRLLLTTNELQKTTNCTDYTRHIPDKTQ